MLAPIQDYLCPQDPKSSPLLCAIKDCYFSRLSVYLHPDQPRFADSQWIKSEGVNVEHLLCVFTSVDMDVLGVWDLCVQFMGHLYWHKPRQTALRSNIERPLDGHPSKPGCLFDLSVLFGSVGNHAEEKRNLTHALTLEAAGERLWGGSNIEVPISCKSDARALQRRGTTGGGSIGNV